MVCFTLRLLYTLGLVTKKSKEWQQSAVRILSEQYSKTDDLQKVGVIYIILFSWCQKMYEWTYFYEIFYCIKSLGKLTS